MIKTENIEVFNWDGAIRGMRNPLNSWYKSDTKHCDDIASCGECRCFNNAEEYVNGCHNPDNGYNPVVLGGADLSLMRKLVKAGSDHRKFLRQIMVSMDITAPLYWWKEFDTYKVGTVANSCSTMHCIHAKEFVPDDFSHDRIAGEYLESLNLTIGILNLARRRYLETKDKTHWDAMIQLLPTSYNQLRTVTLNYEVLFNIHRARHTHKLDEWRSLCETIAALPYFREICLEED